MGVMQLLRAVRPERTRAASLPPVAERAPAAARDAAVRRTTGGSPGLEALERHYGAGVAAAAARIRDALLLHRSGRKSEAWLAFEQLLADPALGGLPQARPMLESEIYSRMRICTEREGCFNAALTPAVLSYVTRAQFFAVQERPAELKVLQSAQFLDRHFTPLVERARLVHALPALRTLVTGYLERLPDVDLASLKSAVEALRRTLPKPTKRAAQRGAAGRG